MAGFHKREELQAVLEENMIAEFLLQQAEIPIQKLASMQMVLLDELTALLDHAWTCNDVLNLCRYLAPQWYASEPAQGWLEYSYWSIISWSYPESVTIEQKADYQTGVQFFARVLRCMLDVKQKHKSFDPFEDFAFLQTTDIEDYAVREEYSRFLHYFRQLYLYELMYIGKELFYFNTLSHIAGVHYVAMHVARQLKEAGVPINLGLVSGAAVGHDIGKFGCKASETKRMAHLHYYYTGQWFEEKNMPTIAHIAVNHSTWDLELENLPLESLVLIYADFRVRKVDCDAPKEKMGIFSLKDSFHIILSKLENVDEAKERRYQYVYAKLKDFEDFMESLGVNTDFSAHMLHPAEQKNIALVDADEAVTSYKFLAIRHNIWLMEFLNTETSLGTLLEAARSETDWKNTRTYIHILEEYYIYLTQRQKQMTLQFLYELLMHREGDIRRQAAVLMGRIIVNFDEIYRKELPAGVTLSEEHVTSLTLWQRYLDKIIMPDHKVIERHKRWMGYTLKYLVPAALENCAPEERYNYLDILLYYYHDSHWDDATGFILMDTMRSVPLKLCEPVQLEELLAFAQNMLGRDKLEIRTAALRFLQYMAKQPHLYGNMKQQILDMLNGIVLESAPAGIRYHMAYIYRYLHADDLEAKLHVNAEEERKAVQMLFLENQKGATPWILKMTNIDMLMDMVPHDDVSLLQVAAHLSNLLKVGEQVSVRHKAGKALVKIIPKLSPTERNEVVIELTKGLEIGEYEFSKYIPAYLGQIAMYLGPQELDELIADLQNLLYSTNNRVVSVVLNTLGVMIEYYPAYESRFAEDTVIFGKRRTRMLGMLLSGLASYDETIASEAFIVLGHNLFASRRLTLEQKYEIFRSIYKRMLILIHDKPLTGLSFLNRAGSLNYIYRFISDYLQTYGTLYLPVPQKIAFFPGTFDPFSLSHKGIVQEIRNMGFHVYLALDEFSWSKKAQPWKVRRQIMQMSVADEENIYLFPGEIPVNIANNDDLAALKALFPDKELYLVVGSDVIMNASSYKKEPQEGTIHQYNHIVFRRVQGESEAEIRKAEQETEQKIRQAIKGDLIYLTLPTYLEDISSTRIRENIDCNRDISNLISPLAQNYIYQHGLYLREPQYKPVLQSRNIQFEIITDSEAPELYQIVEQFSHIADLPQVLEHHWAKPEAMVLVVKEDETQIAAFALSHTMATTDMYRVFENREIVNWMRNRVFGNTAVIEGVYQRREPVSTESPLRNAKQLLMTELLAYYLERDYGDAVYFGRTDLNTEVVLKRQGFVDTPFADMLACSGTAFYMVDMRTPITLLKNMETTIKEPFSSNERVLQVLEESHYRLQEVMTTLYPGNLVLSIDARIMHHKMLKKITKANDVPVVPYEVRRQGEKMCVPFGKILLGKAVPNTVTKSLHSEKVYTGDIKQFTIQNFPQYATLENQVRNIKSFNRPVILVDDLLHKGHRIQGLEPILQHENVEISSMIVGILSARGKDLMQNKPYPVEGVYFLPRLRSWYVESTLYPFIGGDMIEQQEEPNANLIPSINFILPYVVPSYMTEVDHGAMYQFSLTCLENVRAILRVLEEEYQKLFDRRLTLGRLSEAVISPRCPDYGMHMNYDHNIAASVHVENDIQHLIRLQSIME